MFDAILENRLLAAILVVIAVPIVLVGYIYLVEFVVGLFRRTTAGRIRPWLWLAPALVFLGVFLVYPTIATGIRSFQKTVQRDAPSSIAAATSSWDSRTTSGSSPRTTR